MGSSCYSRGDDEVPRVIHKYLSENALNECIDFRGCLCKGQCNKGPNLSIDGRDYHEVNLSNINLILKEAFEPKEPPEAS